MTKLEDTTLAAIVDICTYDYSADVETIAEKTGMTANSVKGVVGSLTKKGLAYCEQENRGGKVFYDIFPKNSDGQLFSNNEWR